MHRSFETFCGVFLIVTSAWLATTAIEVLAQFVHFESPPVHPLELSGNTLLAAHTADHRLVIFDVSGGVPIRTAEIPVGLEPVTVRARNSNEAWVVNHISDTISIVDLEQQVVVATLTVGDEPTDVVFSGVPERAFVSVSQEDCIKVYNPKDLDAAPVVIPLDGSDPRSLAVSNDGSRVYVTIHDSGNNTTVIPEPIVTANGGLPAPNPPMKAGLPPAPEVSLIVKHDGSTWRDDTNGDWGSLIGYTLLDNDVIAIDVQTRTVEESYQGAGTTLFNVAVHPISGELYVTGQDAFNHIRFEPNLVGKFAQNVITKISPLGGTATPVHLNSHINYANAAGDASERAASLSTPLDVAISSSGDRVYVAAFGSAKVGVLDDAGTVLDRIDVGGGPGGLALDESNNRLFVLERFDSSLATIDLQSKNVTSVSLGFDPTPIDVQDGRRLFYDGENSSAHGDLSCASCHIFVGMDNIAWDLGSPIGDMQEPPAVGDPLGQVQDFHPMKGPMATQSMKGLPGNFPFHWRGDREELVDFNPAFVSLMGRDQPLSTGDFQLFETFASSVIYPSNPFRDLNNALPTSLNGANAQNGQALFIIGGLVGGIECVSCHSSPAGGSNLIIPGVALDEAEGKVIPHLRNLYEKTRFDDTALLNVRGFGFIHDGSVDDLFTFLDFRAFTFETNQDQRDVEAFLLSFDTGTHPAVGAQYTFDGVDDAAGHIQLGIMQTVADGSQIGLIAKGKLFPGQPRGWTYQGGDVWKSDKSGEGPLTTAELTGLAGLETPITVTGVLAGDQTRLGIERDGDGFLDGDELDGDSDPGDPTSTPGTIVTASTPLGVDSPSLWISGPNPAGNTTRFSFRSRVGDATRLDVFDVRGRRVRTLVREGSSPGGEQQVGWNLRDESGRSVSSGTYFIRFQSGAHVSTERATVVR